MIGREAKRILIFNDGLELGGTEKLLVDLLAHLENKGCEVTLLLPIESDANVLLFDVPKAVKVRYLYNNSLSRAKRKWNELKMIFRTKSFLKQHRIDENEFDLAICFKEGFYAKMFSGFKIPNILWIHNMLYIRQYGINSLKERISVWLNKKEIKITEKSYQLYDQIVCVSQSCKDSYEQVILQGLPINQEIKIIPNAIDIDKIHSMAEEDVSFKMSDDEVNFIIVTRISPDKRVDRILSVAKRLKEEYTNFHIHIVGIDQDDEWFNDQIKDNQISKYITLHGKVLNPYPYIKQADWLVCVSERESFSLVLLEAMSLGVPVITTDCGGPSDIVEKGEYGMLVDNTSEAVYQGMKDVLEDRTLKEKYTTELDKVVSKYSYSSWQKAINDLLHI